MACSFLVRPTLIVVAAWLLFGPTAFGQADKDLAKVAALACQANLDAFPYFTCNYTMTLAKVDSPAAALRGEYRNAKRFDHLLVVDEQREKLKYLGPPIEPNQKIVPSKKSGTSGVSVDWMPWAYLNKEGNSFNYVVPLETAAVRPPEFPPHIVGWLPPSMGVMGGIRCDGSPWKLIQRYDDGDYTVKASQVDIDGRPMVKLTFAENGHVIHVYWLDIQQGYLPRRALFYNSSPNAKEPRGEAHLLEAKCYSEHWFPTHMLFIQHFSPESMRAVDIRVTDLEVKKRPAPADFTLKVPAGTSIMLNVPGENKHFRLKQDEEISADDIPRLRQMLDRKDQEPLMDTTVHPKGPPYWRYVLIGICAVLAGTGGYVLWRRRAPGKE